MEAAEGKFQNDEVQQNGEIGGVTPAKLVNGATHTPPLTPSARFVSLIQKYIFYLWCIFQPTQIRYTPLLTY